MVLKTSEWRADRNRQALARLTKALPAIFPVPVLTHALNRPFTPPMPRIAVDVYWRAHVIRADRLARALAARTGASERSRACRPVSAIRRHPIASRPSPAVRAFVACAGSRSTASAGTPTCGTADRTRTPYGTPPAWRHGDSGT